MKRILSKFLSKKKLTKLAVIYNLIRHAPYDYNRMFMHNRTLGNSKNRLLGEIIQGYHSIEKGLTMPNRRLGFGQESLTRLVKNIKKYSDSDYSESNQVNHAISVVNEYINLHANEKYELETKTYELLKNISDKRSIQSSKSQISITAKEYFEFNKSSFDLFSKSRHSLRNFSDKEVDITTITKAIDLAKNAPSACNRQSSRVHVYADRDEIQKILKIQGGNRGFGHLTNKLIIVTSDWSGFDGMRERFAPWVDGSLLALNLIYSLHFYKIGACMLNCNLIKEQDNLLRKEANIPNSENIIVMLACGNVVDEFMLAASQRYETNFFTTYH